MGKQARKRRQQDDSFADDKPVYAADRMDPKPKRESAKRGDEAESFLLRDAMKSDVATRLAALKNALVEEAQARPDVPQAHKKAKAAKRRPATERLAENPDLSFAELFDPADDDDVSFEEMLADSKLDWRSFKDE
ncbi:hypothetical protein C7445_10469 [Alicyclobacillus sacchari]|uniref:Uncharacterized protein n=1 Tax=Alicyclobacillus sacchari TaxID=392010 RepID=A0A4R8LQ67_9BACL|nr:hypothetical protein [Alicyclobacillus sacchari]TDY49558.1 hypothetical protein C7445_10469 [Alicyclobacillus sacchari]GMA58578.1 hypothetical protein GCM10025858_30810 [Alicyclobacillus sacchari]